MSDSVGGAGHVRARLYVDGALVDEAWIPAAGAAGAAKGVALRIGEHQASIAAQADADLRAWLVEIYDPAEVPGREYLRFGTDRGAMGDPVPFVPGRGGAYLRRFWPALLVAALLTGLLTCAVRGWWPVAPAP